MSNLTIKQKRSIFVAIAAVLSVVCILLGAFQANNLQIKQAIGEIAVEIEREPSKEYAFGDVFELPQCTFKKDGETAKGIASLQYPDGTQTGKAAVTLNQGGTYVLRYFAEIN
jgi:hypothetical protein